MCEVVDTATHPNPQLRPAKGLGTCQRLRYLRLTQGTNEAPKAEKFVFLNCVYFDKLGLEY